MADAVLDFAGLEAAAPAASTTTTETVENTTPEITTDTTTTTETTEAGKGGDGTAAGTKDNKENTQENTEQANKGGAGAEPTPQAVRQLLKQMKEDPKNAGAVKTLHNAYERSLAYGQEFKTVQEARDAKALLSAAGGAEGIEGLQNFKNAVEESDQLLYAGDPKVIENIVSDLKEQGKLNVLGKLAGPFLEALAANDKEALTSALLPYLVQDIQSEGLMKEIEYISQLADGIIKTEEKDGKKSSTYSARNLQELKERVKVISDWHKGRADKLEASKKTTLSPEQEKLNADKKAFEQQQKEFGEKTSKQFRDGVAAEADKSDNVALGGALKSYLKTPFFKDFPRETLVDLASSIKTELQKRLTGDKAYQLQMKGHWTAKTPDKAKILEYHNAKVESIAEEVVRTVVQRRYPSYSKGASAAAGRAATTQQKSATEQQQNKQSVETGKPIYVATKPKWEAIDFTKDPQQLLYIAGKAYLKGGKFVTWRKQ